MRLCHPAVLAALLLLCGCAREEYTSEFAGKTVTLPSGKVIRVQVMITQKDVLRGMMFRDALPPDRGMLFVHNRAGRYSYWMHNVRVPLDILWMDNEKRIVEIQENAAPCLETDPIKCPRYGGKAEARFVLELNGGAVKQNGLAQGQVISF